MRKIKVIQINGYKYSFICKTGKPKYGINTRWVICDLKTGDKGHFRYRNQAIKVLHTKE